MNGYCAASKSETFLTRWLVLQLTASSAVCPASSGRAWPFVQSRINARRFTINLLGTPALAAAIAVVGSGAAWQAARAQSVPTIHARIVAVNIPGASAIAQVGTFLNNSDVCSHTITGLPILFPHPIPNPPFDSFIQPGAMLDPNRILVGNRSNFGAPLALNVGSAGSFLSIDPSRPGVLSVPLNFAQSGVQDSTLGGAVQMFSANSPH